MTREEFLKELRIALQGRISQSQVNEQLHYYENYIMEESRKGRTEEEVIAEIGNPRLAAKTLTDLYGDETYHDSGQKTYETGSAAPKKRKLRRGRFLFHTWYSRILTGIAAILLLVLSVKIGMILIPILAAAVLTGGIVFLIYLVFFGKK